MCRCINSGALLPQPPFPVKKIRNGSMPIEFSDFLFWTNFLPHEYTTSKISRCFLFSEWIFLFNSSSEIMVGWKDAGGKSVSIQERLNVEEWISSFNNNTLIYSLIGFIFNFNLKSRKFYLTAFRLIHSLPNCTSSNNNRILIELNMREQGTWDYGFVLRFY